MKTPVLILAGGFGTRLRSAVGDVPKPLAPVPQLTGRPFLGHLLDELTRQGVERVILSLHYEPERFKKFLEAEQWTGPSGPVRIQSVVEPAPLDTGGAVRWALRSLGVDEPVIVANGDTFIPDGAQELEAAASDGDSMLGLVQVPDVSRYGQPRVDPAGRITGFERNPELREPGWIHAGLSWIRTEAFLRETETLGERFSLERDLMARWAIEGRVRAARLSGSFIDIGVPEDYARFCAENAI